MSLLKLVLLGFATYRVSLLFTTDSWPFAIMTRFRNYLGKRANGYGLWWSLAELFNCALCFGVWATFLVYFLPDWITLLLAIMGIQAFLVNISAE